MLPGVRHAWDVDAVTAKNIQLQLASKVRLQPLQKPPQLIAGVDAAFAKTGDRIWAAAVLLEFPTMQLVETQVAEGVVTFPYIPGLFAFREGPFLLKVLAMLSQLPDVIFFDGHGIAHPRKMGLASHLGILLDRPTIGVAKTRLIGEYEELSDEKGAFSPLFDHDQQIGLVLRTRSHVKPIFVSPGYLVDFYDCLQLVLATCTKYRLPEPIRLSHQKANSVRMKGQRL